MNVRIIVLVIGAIALIAAVATAALASLRLADPMGALRLDPGGTRVVADSSYPVTTEAGERRLYRDLTVATENAGTIRVTTSRPAEPGSEPLPLVVVLAGLRTGRESLGVLAEHGPNLLVGFQYPYDQETWYQRARLAQVGGIRRAVLTVPWQVAHVTRRLAAESHVDEARSALLGYSFGALFVPATQRLAAEDGHDFGATVLAFGGVDIQRLMDANLRVRPRPVRATMAWIVATLLHPMEPEHHLPHLAGRFLIIRGAADEQIPADLSRRLAELTPRPRDVMTLDAGHMNPRDPVLTEHVVAISQDWLERQGVINRPE